MHLVLRAILLVFTVFHLTNAEEPQQDKIGRASNNQNQTVENQKRFYSNGQYPQQYDMPYGMGNGQYNGFNSMFGYPCQQHCGYPNCQPCSQYHQGSPQYYPLPNAAPVASQPGQSVLQSPDASQTNLLLKQDEVDSYTELKQPAEQNSNMDTGDNQQGYASFDEQLTGNKISVTHNPSGGIPIAQQNIMPALVDARTSNQLKRPGISHALFAAPIILPTKLLKLPAPKTKPEAKIMKEKQISILPLVNTDKLVSEVKLGLNEKNEKISSEPAQKLLEISDRLTNLSKYLKLSLKDANMSITPFSIRQFTTETPKEVLSTSTERKMSKQLTTSTDDDYIREEDELEPEDEYIREQDEVYWLI
ncbi:hypothetical protein ACOME3_008298 [Neoechinorhynchus agilis]